MLENPCKPVLAAAGVGVVNAFLNGAHHKLEFLNIAHPMATGEIPFETAGQIEDKLLQYEELFKSRYTKDDPWYASTVQREQR